ncbi:MULTISPECIES: sodium:proton exchanger [Micromonospora]|nr:MULTISPECIES: sodium:proton exchanger [Micromonospora]MBC8993707.1 sodium:proton exchanger [Micromonospora chalcea]MCT2278971.1 sodium:proton exchanger [Micromonospora chalcea]MDG4752722.1 sodium:proton exchanger [Micromonospora sp. WMMD718]UFN92527.1 sodium:proton exchanger [Micromonospora aurantiaca]
MSAEIEMTVSGRGAAARIGIALAVAAPAVVVRLAGVQLAPVAAMVVFGAAVLAAVALLMWASEAARVDISGSLALAILALVAILPEYAVDIFFAYTAGHDPAYAAYATANMTGANRLLIGVAWPLLVAFAIFAVRRRRVRGERDRVTLAPHRRTEIVFLAAATVYALVIPLTGRLAWYDTLVLGGLFAAYLWRIRGNEEGVEELAGVAATVAAQPAARRRGLVAALFVAAGAIILAAAEPFGDSLVAAGADLGIDEFLLVQWLAPIASEAPEVIVAITFALRGRADDGMGALLAAKLNQWTLLIACLPIAYYLGGGEFAGLPLDARQTEELVLTTAQTLLGVAVLADLRLTRGEALLLFGLFAVQFVLPAPNIRYVIAAVYTVLAVALLIRQRRHVPALIKSL